MSRASPSQNARYQELILDRGVQADHRERGNAGTARRSARARPRRSPLRIRARRIVAVAVALVLADVCLSFGRVITAPSNTPLGVRVVEWLRDNGAAWLVSDAERLYYSWNAPAAGGPALSALPQVGAASAPTAGVFAPPRISPLIYPPLPGEGVWHGTGPLVRGAPAVLVTSFRPDPSYPQMVAGVAWIDSSRTWLQLYPGRYEPPNSGNVTAEVPPRLRGGLLAAFNSGFKLEDDGGGLVAFGRTYAPLRSGQATFIRYRDGTADVRPWTGGPDPGPNVEFARQNLVLIVDGGLLNPNLSDGPQWGATLGNAIRVWRSGVGVDAHGNIIYAGADDQTAASLAEILRRAGAIRAMELDINSEWVTFNYYATWGAGDAQKLLPAMTRDPTRYLSPDDRDFFAVYARKGG